MSYNKKFRKGVNFKNVFLLYKKEDASFKLIKKYTIEIIKNLEKFYKNSAPKINIELFYSRNEFNKKIGYKTPDWLIGFAEKNNIYIFSPLIIEKVSNHKKSETKKLLSHEICHIFNNKINKDSLMWADEGLALFLTKQKKNNNFTKENVKFFYNNYFDKNIKLGIFSENDGYKISYWAMKIAMEKLTGKNIINLIKINSKRKNCRQILKGILKIPINDFLDKINKNASLF